MRFLIALIALLGLAMSPVAMASPVGAAHHIGGPLTSAVGDCTGSGSHDLPADSDIRGDIGCAAACALLFPSQREALDASPRPEGTHVSYPPSPLAGASPEAETPPPR